jgi:hypothetical protein
MILQYICSSNIQESFRQMAAIQLKNIMKKVYGVKSETESHYNEKKKDDGE